MIGVSVGNYVIAEKIGEGGMGVVYRASHQTLGRQVAVKVLHGDSHRTPELVSRFFNEAKAATEIRHPNHRRHPRLRPHTGRHGHTSSWSSWRARAWRRLLAREPVLESSTRWICRARIAAALAAAHARGIVHRDLKPDNIFLVQRPRAPRGERVKVLDFGIAKLTGDQAGRQRPRPAPAC